MPDRRDAGPVRIYINLWCNKPTHRMAMRMRSSLAPGGACPLAMMAWKAGSTKSASKSSEMVASGLVWGVGGDGVCVV